jgi:hypothetical protein
MAPFASAGDHGAQFLLVEAWGGLSSGMWWPGGSVGGLGLRPIARWRVGSLTTGGR